MFTNTLLALSLLFNQIDQVHTQQAKTDTLRFSQQYLNGSTSKEAFRRNQEMLEATDIIPRDHPLTIERRQVLTDYVNNKKK